MKLASWAAALLVLTGCINMSFHVGSKKQKPAAPGDPVTVPDSSLAPAINAFAVDLYRSLAATPGNLIFSPLSISTVLTSLVSGASGNTRSEMLHVLHLSGPASYRGLMAGLDESARVGGAAWSAANRAWVQSGLKLQPSFTKTVREGFEYDIGEADFIHSPEPSRVAINHWVEQQTQDRIQDLFPAGSIDASMRIVLANAIYFKGFWDSQFDKKATSQAPFHLSATQDVSVPMMSQTHDFGLRTIAGGRVLELPYRGRELSMLVVLPDDSDGLAALEKQITPEAVRDWGNLKTTDVSVSLPRFTSKQHFNLTRTLAGLGMPSAFDAHAADFSAMTGGRDLFLSIIVHEAFVDVNEEGTEAAAATGGGMALLSTRAPKTFRADHPFLFLIRDPATGCILFMGRVTDPRG